MSSKMLYHKYLGTAAAGGYANFVTPGGTAAKTTYTDASYSTAEDAQVSITSDGYLKTYLLGDYDVYVYTAGGVQISSASALNINPQQDSSIDSPESYCEFFDHFLGDALDSRYTVTSGSDAQAVDPSIYTTSMQNGILLLECGDDAGATMALNGSQITLSSNWTPGLNGGTDFLIESAVYANSIADIVFFFGMTDTTALEMPFTLSGTTLTSNATDAFGFLFDTDATTDNFWLCGVDSDVDHTHVNSGLALGTSYKKLRIQVDSGADATFYIDDVAVGTLDNVPSAAGIPILAAFSRAASNKEVYADYLKVKSSRD